MIEDLAPTASVEESVETVSLLDLLSMHAGGDRADQIVFVKLDIEGMEQTVLSALSTHEHSDLVLLYEDHGRDAQHETTRFLLERHWRMLFLTDGGPVEIVDTSAVAQLNVLKDDPVRGYNLVAFAPTGPAATRLGLTPGLMGR